MNDKLSDKDKALWEATLGIEKSEEKEKCFADLLEEHNKQEGPPIKKETLKKPSVPSSKPSQKSKREPLDRAIERKLKQGKIEPDSTIDLHGLNQQAAHRVLCKNIESAYRAHKKYMLVITGKGKGSAKAEDWLTPGEGILKQKLPLWIKTEPLKDYIIDGIMAHSKHGGSGAYYLIIKKKK